MHGPSLQRHICMASASGAPCSVSLGRSPEQRPQGLAPQSQAASLSCALSLTTGHLGASHHTDARDVCFQKRVSPRSRRGSFCWGAIRSVSRADRPSVCVQGGRAGTQGREGRAPLPPPSSHSRPSRGPCCLPHCSHSCHLSGLPRPRQRPQGPRVPSLRPGPSRVAGVGSQGSLAGHPRLCFVSRRDVNRSTSCPKKNVFVFSNTFCFLGMRPFAM